MTISSHSPPVRRRWRARRELIDVARSTQSAAAERLLESTRRAALFYPLVACASAMAAAGLVLDDDVARLLAVILTPVATPVLGTALGVATGDNALLRRSLVRGVTATVVALTAAFVVSHAIPHEPLRDVLVARSVLRPAHLAIALAAGIAATLGFRERQLPTAIPGAVLAVLTLLPAAALGVAFSEGDGATGAAWLRLCASVVFVILGSVLAFVALGTRYRGPLDELPPRTLVSRFGPSAMLVAALSIVATNVAARTSREQRREAAVRRILSATLLESVGARLLGTTISPSDDALDVVASVAAPSAVTAHQVVRLEDSLRAVVDARMRLTVRSVVTRDVDRFGLRLLAAAPPNDATVLGDTLFLDRAASALRQMTSTWSGVSLESIRQERRHGAHIVTAVMRTPRNVSPLEVDELQQELMRRLDAPVALIVRSLVSGDVSSSDDARETARLEGSTAAPGVGP